MGLVYGKRLMDISHWSIFIKILDCVSIPLENPLGCQKSVDTNRSTSMNS